MKYGEVIPNHVDIKILSSGCSKEIPNLYSSYSTIIDFEDFVGEIDKDGAIEFLSKDFMACSIAPTRTSHGVANE